MDAPVEFWFDFASTYSYPAAMRVEAMCLAAGVPLRWRPFLLGPIFAAQGWRDSPFNLYPVKGRYMWRDLERICAANGLPLRRPTVFPRNGLLAARAACAGGDAAWVPAFVRGIYGANFADDRDISDAAVVAEVLAAAGADADTVLAAARSPAVKEELRAQTDEAVRRGLCGAPSFTVGDELFWGNDRLDAALGQWRSQRADDDAPWEPLLAFWFGAVHDARERETARRRWFASTPEHDALCAARFGGLVAQALRGELDDWQRTARGRLALIILLDQLPRNVFRGSAAAFAGDAKAAAIALVGIASGADRALDWTERAFVYLPLSHAEDRELQARGVAAFESLAAEAPAAERDQLMVWVTFARGHRNLIDRFGRFPHRNHALGREPTATEREYLARDPERFGQ
jgi:uncharacterized protein (DUF924 family)/2-hydroxychromene-2-carboxylate isomerase